mmetsp:Transcript_18601/g.58123  ORF Transcript_18601/g.58123 Transcript_18601/m.58123 type:complete len:475 (-) Transcript_18601:149-1573(-)
MAYGAIPPVEGTQRVAAASRKRRLVATAAGALALAVLGVATVRPGGVGRAVGSFAETAPGAGLASASQDGSSTSGEAEKEADCGLKDLAYFTMIGNGEATFTRAGVQGDFTFYNFSIGPSNLAPVVAVRVEDGDRDMYSTMKTPVFLKDWRYGFLKDGMDFNPDSFVVPEDKLVNDDNMSAAITIRFSEDDDSTTLFAAQFVALDKPKSDTDLYTMVVRVYTDDTKTEAQLQSSRGEDHTCYDPAKPHFHMFPHDRLGARLGSSDAELVVSEAFVVEVYLGIIAAGVGLVEAGEAIVGAVEAGEAVAAVAEGASEVAEAGTDIAEGATDGAEGASDGAEEDGCKRRRLTTVGSDWSSMCDPPSNAGNMRGRISEDQTPEEIQARKDDITLQGGNANPDFPDDGEDWDNWITDHPGTRFVKEVPATLSKGQVALGVAGGFVVGGGTIGGGYELVKYCKKNPKKCTQGDGPVHPAP